MAARHKTYSRWDVDEDVTFFSSGGRNVTWRITHDPTGIFVEGSTQLTEATFTKKHLRVAAESLREKLLAKLKRKVLAQGRKS
jgi:hypothetical protein